ncbi:MAG: flagellar biosynthetic protein FliR [Caulobacterales bacterium]
MTDGAIAAYADNLIAMLLVSLRIGPTLAFAPPFTLIKIPLFVRVFLGVALSAALVGAYPQAHSSDLLDQSLVAAAASELLLGISLAIALQLAFAAILTAGRAIDFQVGFGLSLIADPTLRTQMPLIGTLFAYAAGAVFFATNGPNDLVAIWTQSLRDIPVGAFAVSGDLSTLLTYISTVFVLALGLGGIAVVTLFICDLAIAFMSRTLPQMNVLLLGFQVKTIALLMTLPFAFSFSGALFLRIVRLAIDTTPRLG